MAAARQPVYLGPPTLRPDGLRAVDYERWLRESKPRPQSRRSSAVTSAPISDDHTWNSEEIHAKKRLLDAARREYVEKMARLSRGLVKHDEYNFINSWSIELAAEAGLPPPQLVEPLEQGDKDVSASTLSARSTPPQAYTFTAFPSKHHVFKHLAPYLPGSTGAGEEETVSNASSVKEREPSKDVFGERQSASVRSASVRSQGDELEEEPPSVHEYDGLVEENDSVMQEDDEQGSRVETAFEITSSTDEEEEIEGSVRSQASAQSRSRSSADESAQYVLDLDDEEEEDRTTQEPFMQQPAEDDEEDELEETDEDTELFGQLREPIPGDVLQRLRPAFDDETADVLYDSASDAASYTELTIDDQDVRRHRNAGPRPDVEDEADAREQEAYFDEEDADQTMHADAQSTADSYQDEQYAAPLDKPIYPSLGQYRTEEATEALPDGQFSSFADFMAEQSPLPEGQESVDIDPALLEAIPEVLLEAARYGSSAVDEAPEHRAPAWLAMDESVDLDQSEQPMHSLDAVEAEPSEVQVEAYQQEREASAVEDKPVETVAADEEELFPEPQIRSSSPLKSALQARSATSSRSALDVPSAVRDMSSVEPLSPSFEPLHSPADELEALPPPTPAEALAMLRQNARHAAEQRARAEASEKSVQSIADEEERHVHFPPAATSALQHSEVPADEPAVEAASEPISDVMEAQEPEEAAPSSIDVVEVASNATADRQYQAEVVEATSSRATSVMSSLGIESVRDAEDETSLVHEQGSPRVDDGLEQEQVTVPEQAEPDTARQQSPLIPTDQPAIEFVDEQSAPRDVLALEELEPPVVESASAPIKSAEALEQPLPNSSEETAAVPSEVNPVLEDGQQVIEDFLAPIAQGEVQDAQEMDAQSEDTSYVYQPNAISPGLWQPGEPIRFFGESTEAAVREAFHDPERHDHLVEALHKEQEQPVVEELQASHQPLLQEPEVSDDEDLEQYLIPKSIAPAPRAPVLSVQASVEDTAPVVPETWVEDVAVAKEEIARRSLSPASLIVEPRVTRSRSRRQLDGQQPSDSAISADEQSEPVAKKRRSSRRAASAALTATSEADEGDILDDWELVDSVAESQDPLSSQPRRSRRQRGEKPELVKEASMLSAGTVKIVQPTQEADESEEEGDVSETLIPKPRRAGSVTRSLRKQQSHDTTSHDTTNEKTRTKRKRSAKDEPDETELPATKRPGWLRRVLKR